MNVVVASTLPASGMGPLAVHVSACAYLEQPPSGYALCFRSLFQSGRGFSFPCDARGEVHLDALSERARNNYFYARAMVGRELAPPSIAGLDVAPAPWRCMETVACKRAPAA